MSYLIDTNTCIYIIKKKPQSTLERLHQISLSQLSVSVITVAELAYGVRKSSFPDKNKIALNEFLTPISILNFDYAAAIQYGIIRNELERKGTPIGPLDMLIAAHAISMKLILVTNNVREFNRIDGLLMENWTT